jgi:hypothetical protein
VRTENRRYLQFVSLRKNYSKTIVLIEPPSRHSFRLLGVALAISLAIAFPMEQVIHTAPYLWELPSCSAEVQIALSLSSIVQAILTPLLLFLLPGPGSILRTKIAPKPAHQPRQPALFISAGLWCASAIPLACWYGLREYAALHNTCGLLFDLERPIDIWHVDSSSDFAHYFIYSSVLSAFWVGITAGGLRLQSARAAEGDSPGTESREFHDFHWACFLGWAVQYRLSQWCFLPFERGQTEWVNFAFWSFIALTVTSLWVLAFTRSLWDKRPRTRQEAVMQALWRSFLIYPLSALTLIWNPWAAGGVLTPVFITLDALGFAWAVTVGTWRWRALQKEPPVTAVVHV